MNTVDKVVEVPKKKPGRPKKADTPTPEGAYRIEEAKKARAVKGDKQVVEKWYEIRSHKLILCKRVKSGTVYRTYVGSTQDKKHGADVQAFAKKLEEEGRLRHRM
jgi:hypothetical protein